MPRGSYAKLAAELASVCHYRGNRSRARKLCVILQSSRGVHLKVDLTLSLHNDSSEVCDNMQVCVWKLIHDDSFSFLKASWGLFCENLHH